ncbi:MAG: hypothetical protein ACLSA6_07705 [Holdemania massiliensis]
MRPGKWGRKDDKNDHRAADGNFAVLSGIFERYADHLLPADFGDPQCGRRGRLYPGRRSMNLRRTAEFLQLCRSGVQAPNAAIIMQRRTGLYQAISAADGAGSLCPALAAAAGCRRGQGKR